MVNHQSKQNSFSWFWPHVLGWIRTLYKSK